MTAISEEQRYAVLDRIHELMDWTNVGTPDEEKWQWKCGRETDRLAFTRQAIAETLPSATIEDITGGRHYCCDCEIAFNCDDREEDEE